MPLHLPPPAGGPPPMPTPMPVRTWSDYARDEWARLELAAIRTLPAAERARRYRQGLLEGQFSINQVRAAEGLHALDELRPPETDEEPWDVLDAAILGTAWWATAVAAVLGLLLLVLAALGIRKAVRR